MKFKFKFNFKGTQGEWLKATPGVDTVLASLIAGEVGDANRFASPKQLVAHAGMGASKRRSGDGDPNGRMPERGTPYLRHGPMQAADCARKCDPHFGGHCAKAVARGKHHHVAVSGVARKLAGVILSVMKEGRAYEPAPPSHHRPGRLRAQARAKQPNIPCRLASGAAIRRARIRVLYPIFVCQSASNPYSKISGLPLDF